MKLLDLYTLPDDRWEVPLALLREREPHENISHRTMPTWEQHCAYIRGRPHLAWYLIEDDGHDAGCVYLSRQREIGVGVLKAYRGQGLAKAAVRELMRLHPGRFLANINPHNAASIEMFLRLGFGGPIQVTMEKTA